MMLLSIQCMICNTFLSSFGETEAVETWRSEKLKEAKELIQEQNGVNSTIIVEEAGTTYHDQRFIF